MRPKNEFSIQNKSSNQPKFSERRANLLQAEQRLPFVYALASFVLLRFSFNKILQTYSFNHAIRIDICWGIQKQVNKMRANDL